MYPGTRLLFLIDFVETNTSEIRNPIIPRLFLADIYSLLAGDVYL